MQSVVFRYCNFRVKALLESLLCGEVLGVKIGSYEYVRYFGAMNTYDILVAINVSDILVAIHECDIFYIILQPKLRIENRFQSAFGSLFRESDHSRRRIDGPASRCRGHYQ